MGARSHYLAMGANGSLMKIDCVCKMAPLCSSRASRRCRCLLSIRMLEFSICPTFRFAPAKMVRCSSPVPSPSSTRTGTNLTSPARKRSPCAAAANRRTNRSATANTKSADSWPANERSRSPRHRNNSVGRAKFLLSLLAGKRMRLGGSLALPARLSSVTTPVPASVR